MKFFLDNNLSHRLAEALECLSEGHSVIHITKKFAPSTPDVDWITGLASEGDWVVVSGDCKIMKRRAERQVFLDSKLTAFFLMSGWTKASFWAQAKMLVRWWPDIIDEAKRSPTGGIFEVPYAQNGKFNRL